MNKFTHNDISIEAWEYLMAFVYMLVLYLVFARRKNMHIKREPEYRYYLWGLWAKVLGGIAFSMVYFYYYKGGDTIFYYYSALSMVNLAWQDPAQYLEVLLMPASPERLSYFTMETGRPYGIIYYAPRNFAVVRFTSVIALFTFRSYVVTTVVLASLVYFGAWRCFRTFAGYFPALTGKMALAFLFMPSVFFWGSAIMKDTFTFMGLCWGVHCFDEFVFKKHRGPSVVMGLMISTAVIIAVKPYIFITLFPMLVVWLLYDRLLGIKNAMVKFVVLPFAVFVMVMGSFMVLAFMGDSLDKFSVDSMVETVVVTKNDMQRAEEYGENYFDVGTLEMTWGSVLSKAPAAVAAALFRPYLWEVRNVVMVFSALENLFLLLLCFTVFWRVGVLRSMRYVLGSPLLIVCFGFTILFGFGVGISTPNFGALVRLRIPLVPFFVAGLYILDHLHKRLVHVPASGKRVTLRDLRHGDPDREVPGKGKRHVVQATGARPL